MGPIETLGAEKPGYRSRLNVRCVGDPGDFLALRLNHFTRSQALAGAASNYVSVHRLRLPVRRTAPLIWLQMSHHLMVPNPTSWQDRFYFNKCGTALARKGRSQERVRISHERTSSQDAASSTLVRCAVALHLTRLLVEIITKVKRGVQVVFFEECKFRNVVGESL